MKRPSDPITPQTRPQMYLLVEPYTRNPERRYQDAAVWSEHLTVESAYAAPDAFAERTRTQGVAPETFELYVVDEQRRPMPRPGLQ